MLLIPGPRADRPFKAVFKDFFEWFLHSRYLRHLLIDGKMDNKAAYIHYKNSILLPILHQISSQIDKDTMKTRPPIEDNGEPGRNVGRTRSMQLQQRVVLDLQSRTKSSTGK
jgi:hypothetical protein